MLFDILLSYLAVLYALLLIYTTGESQIVVHFSGTQCLTDVSVCGTSLVATPTSVVSQFYCNVSLVGYDVPSTLPRSCIFFIAASAVPSVLGSEYQNCDSLPRRKPPTIRFRIPVTVLQARQPDEVARLAGLTALFLRRSLFRRHDFAARLLLLRNPRCLVNVPPVFDNIITDNMTSHQHSPDQPDICLSARPNVHFVGGGRPASLVLKGSFLSPFCVDGYNVIGLESSDFGFVQYIKLDEALDICNEDGSIIPFCLPIHQFSNWLTRDELRNMATLHDIRFTSRDRKPALINLFADHGCDICAQYVSLFKSHDPVPSKRECNREYKRKSRQKLKEEKETPSKSKFPPCPPSSSQTEQIVNNFCADTSPSAIEESGCAVCGQLKLFTDLIPIDRCDCDLSLLIVSNVSRQERWSIEEPVRDLDGPVIDRSCKNVCWTCIQSLQKGKTPKHALANGLWIGDVPDELKDLTLSEKMMIARVRHNRAVVRVSSGRAKMIANVIMFSNPTLTVYHALPPSRDEMKEILAVIFTGSAQPTVDDFKRTPLLVRREKVSNALDWLKLNHRDYKDLEISKENLASYPLSGVPVVIDYKKTQLEESNKILSAMSMHDLEEEEGTEEGVCPFTVHGITSDEYTKLSMTALKARAFKHLESQGKTLGIGHDDKPLSMYDNPEAYPQMFPWLFPYGYGGIGQAQLKKKVSEAEHKRSLLMYHDKRFQTDLYFPIVAFNHEQMKAGVTGSFLLAKRQSFNEISRRLTSLDPNVLSDLVKRMSSGEYVRAETMQEKACFSILDDLDHVGGHVKGSLTSKKYMRNEIWSLISFLGAPSWFITLSPADNRHPICLYFADTGERFSPELRSSADRNRLIAANPVAAARFFDLMVRSFIKNVLGVDRDYPGLYGKTSGYYGTVEQQGRLTLHLHLLLWIEGALSPQEIRDRLMSKDSIFQRELIEYLEGVHKGEFLTGSMESVRAAVPTQTEHRGGIHAVIREQQPNAPLAVREYQDPTQTLPEPAPRYCVNYPMCECNECESNSEWWKDYHKTIDDLLLKSNIHRCATSLAASSQSQVRPMEDDVVSSKAAKQGPKGCIDRNGVCRARFPRECHEVTTVDEADGHVVMKKLEPYMNNFTPCLTYLTRCNTDVTSLLSGTSIKAIVSYISDYVTKPALKTHQVFSAMYDVFENKAATGTDNKRDESSRRLILKIANSLSAKMEIGSPMASMYLLNNPDHYTGHIFVPFWWKSYVSYVRRSSNEPTIPTDICADEVSNENNDRVGIKREDGVSADNHANEASNENDDRVRIGREDGVYFATTNIDDYKYRPEVYRDVPLYKWIQTSHKRRLTKKERESLQKLSSSDNKSDTANTYHQFEEGHPMRATHVVKCDFERTKHVVPNVVGGALPRHDRGNREYYCCTMLTLFCPWRHALHMKQQCESWESAFNAYRFSARQRQLMRNFNLRYECLDARDDFHAQLRAKIRLRGSHYNGDDLDTDTDDAEDYVVMPPTGRIDKDVLGRSYLSSLKAMDSISAVLSKSGWLDRCKDTVVDTYERLRPDYVPGSSWSNMIKNQCSAIFKQKFIGYSPIDKDRNSSGLHNGSKTDDLVRLLPAEYFRKDFRAEKMESNRLIDDTVSQFSLNKEQERAFRIIANHVSSVATEQLKMHLGGMGGTGKSQVIKSLIYLFEQRKETHRFVALAPTGTAATLLNGSTYHKVLGIQRKGDVGEDFSRSETAILNEARSRLQGVEYIFVDEISMIACHELYSISARLAQITGVHDAPFGGMNVILAGDFAQLPPVFGSNLYDGKIENFVNARMSIRDQETVIGKLLWHQITTVVILTQNMRQKSQSEADAKLRTALENMRYAACTPEDVAFLRTRIADRNESSPSLEAPCFRNVSIITARNNQKDRINDEGARRFAADRNVELTDFYSLDELAGGDDPTNRTRRRKRRKRRNNVNVVGEPTLSGLTKADQEALWECYPHMSDHVPARLSLCVGMPVMIRSNEATELCVTKGQEAVVVGWDARDGPYGRQVLETLFVRLVKPPKDVQISNLPTNVIPLVKISTNVQCRAKSDQSLRIKRLQVPVLPNFAMTDYSSQGKTREYNVVDLGYCRDHQSYYTALSRSSSAAGTVLIQDFAPHKITRGISGWLRQEFRELNVLDEVTRLRYERQLPDHIHGPLRNPVIRAYYLWNRDSSDDCDWHPAIRYQAGERKVRPIESDATWDIDKLRKADESYCSSRSKRGIGAMVEHVNDTSDAVRITKVSRVDCPAHISTVSRPSGLIWDSRDYSCAYDALFTILYNMWIDMPNVWSRRFNDISMHLSTLADKFQLVTAKVITLEEARNAVRRKLNHLNSREYPMGPTYTCIATLTYTMMTNERYQPSGMTSLKCPTCGYQGNTLLHVGEYLQLRETGPLQDGSQEYSHISDCLGWHLSDQQRISRLHCPRRLPTCSTGHSNLAACHRLVLDISMNRLPYVMCVILHKSCFKINETLTYVYEGMDVTFRLRGIVYGDGNHFVARLFTRDGRIWFHDGIATRDLCIPEGTLDQIPDDMWLTTSSRGYDRRDANLVVYARD